MARILKKMVASVGDLLRYRDPYEDYLRGAVDLADLEHRMKEIASGRKIIMSAPWGLR